MSKYIKWVKYSTELGHWLSKWIQTDPHCSVTESVQVEEIHLVPFDTSGGWMNSDDFTVYRFGCQKYKKMGDCEIKLVEENTMDP